MCFMAGSSNRHYACLTCRKVFRRRQDMESRAPRKGEHPCPDCGAPMMNLGPYFKAPKRTDLKQWAKVSLLAESGYFYHPYHPPSCCTWDGPGARPRRLREVPEFLVPEPGPLRELAAYRMRRAMRRCKDRVARK